MIEKETIYSRGRNTCGVVKHSGNRIRYGAVLAGRPASLKDEKTIKPVRENTSGTNPTGVRPKTGWEEREPNAAPRRSSYPEKCLTNTPVISVGG